MADLHAALSGAPAIAFMVSGGLVYEIIAAACSSPQTTEINAGARSKTLMKWVHLGLVQAGIFVGVAAYISDCPLAVVAGGGMAAAMMYLSYDHARKAGLASELPGTETY